MFDLEQKIGSEIIWVRGMSWEEMITFKKAIPNLAWRFCTTWLKIVPIFYHLFLRDQIPCKMRIGYRADEPERVNNFSESIKVPTHMRFYPNSNRWGHKWQEFNWREGEFPLIRDGIFHYHIQDYWKGKGIEFPSDSNCQNCFWKPIQQLRKNFDTNPSIMQWAAIQEVVHGATFKKEMPLQTVKRVGIQQDFAFGGGSGCQAGFCTD